MYLPAAAFSTSPFPAASMLGHFSHSRKKKLVSQNLSSQVNWQTIQMTKIIKMAKLPDSEMFSVEPSKWCLQNGSSTLQHGELWLVINVPRKISHSLHKWNVNF